MGPAEKTAHRSPATEVVRRPPLAADVTSPAVSALQRIQRCAGNRAAEQLLTEGDGRLHRCGPVPCNCSPEERLAKEGLARAAYDGLPVSHPAEPAEREADEVADRVMLMRNGDATVHIGPAPRPSVHRHAEDVATLQASPDTSLAAGIARHARGGGQALDAGARQFMEARFGRGLDDVRVHTDAAAGRLARQVDSYAFTVGRHIFFAPGRYRPENHDGRRLLAHELTHVVQQYAVGPAPAVRRQARPGGQPSAGPAPVSAEKVSGTLESAYRRLGDTRRAAAIRMCREHGGGACSIVLTQAEVRQLYELAQRSGGDEQKIRAGLPAAAPAALGVVPASGLTVGMLTPGLPPAVPVPPLLAPPVPTPPVGVPGYPTWAPPPPVATVPAAEVAAGEIAGAEAVGATVSVAAVSAVAVAALVVACALVVYEAWQFSKFQWELEAKGFIILDDALAVCIHGCHATAQPIRPLPDLDVPFRPLPEFPFPGRPFPLPGDRFPWPDIEIGGPRRRPPEPDEEREEPEDRRRERRRDRRRRPDQGPDVDIDPRPDERRRPPEEPCDRSWFHPCDGGLAFDQAKQIVSQLPGFPSAHSRRKEAVNDGACWVDGRSRSRAEALAVGAVHQTWNLPNGDKLATIKCCPCCIRGGTGATGMHCTIN